MARATGIAVGTCSWTDRTLVAETDWYPKRSMSAAERLAFYAGHFSLVEADATYYFPPSPALTRGWAERTPAGFTLDVKAYGLLTGHPVRADSIWPDLREALPATPAGRRGVYARHLDPDLLEEGWTRFAAALRPLVDAGKLGAILLQYPPWFTARASNRAELAAVRRRWPDLPVCVELRSPTWWADGHEARCTLASLRDYALAHVVVDAPASSGLPPVVAVSHPDLAVVRFHGRNDTTWKGRTVTAAERFRYLYDREELTGWVPRLRELSGQAGRVHALFNNCYRDYGVRNAAELAELLACAY